MPNKKILIRALKLYRRSTTKKDIEAAIQFLKNNVADVSSKKIVLLGTGKIGRNTCKNVVDYLQITNVTLINRTEEKALELATELGLQTASYDDMATEVATADVVIVATNSEQPIILKNG